MESRFCCSISWDAILSVSMEIFSFKGNLVFRDEMPFIIQQTLRTRTFNGHVLHQSSSSTWPCCGRAFRMCESKRSSSLHLVLSAHLVHFVKGSLDSPLKLETVAGQTRKRSP